VVLWCARGYHIGSHSCTLVNTYFLLTSRADCGNALKFTQVYLVLSSVDTSGDVC